MIEQEIEAAEKRSREANEHFLRIKTVHDQAKAVEQDAVVALQGAVNDLVRVRAEVLLGDAPQKDLSILRKKIVQIRQDVDELPSALDILHGKVDRLRLESVRAQQELGHLETVRDYPIVLAAFIKAGKDDGRVLGRLNTLAAQIGKGEEVRRLAAEIRNFSMYPSRHGDEFKFTPDP